MSESQPSIEQAIAERLKALGYSKRAATWHRERDQLISVVNLQKSQWGEGWYLNLGVYLRALGEEVRPAEARCHVRCRATLEAILTGEQASAAIDTVGLPWLEALSTLGGVAAFVASDAAQHCMVDARVRNVASATSYGPPA